MKKRSVAISTSKKNENNQALLGAVAGGAVANMTSTSTPVIMTCPPDDTTFMCKLTRFYNSFKMIISLVLIVLGIVVAAWVAWTLYKSGSGVAMVKNQYKTHLRAAGGGACGCSMKSG